MKKIKYFLKSFVGIMIFNAIIFIAAGKLNYVEGLTYLSISILGLALNVITMQNKEELMNERSKPSENTKGWDKKILVFLAIITIISYIIAGLDSGRFHWSPNFSTIYFILGIIFVFVGQVIFLVSKNQNEFFSSVARIQTERNHIVCDKGLYKIVRHSGYLGMIISWIGFPFVLCSIYSAIPVLFAILLLILRTSLEDKMLEEELSGYKEYKQRVKYKLVPYIW